MCGPQTFRPSQSLGGALVVLSPPPPPSSQERLPISAISRLPTPPPEDEEEAGDGTKPSSSSPLGLSGHLVFHTPAASRGQATHATFFFGGRDLMVEGEDCLANCVVGIHSTGDLRRDHPRDAQALLYSFEMGRRGSMAPVDSSSVRTEEPSSCSSSLESWEVPLSRPLEIGVGGQGIIGRRVSVWCADGGTGGERGVLLAEGVIGFN